MEWRTIEKGPPPSVSIKLNSIPSKTHPTMSEAPKPEEKPRSTAEVDFTKYKVHRLSLVYFFALF